MDSIITAIHHITIEFSGFLACTTNALMTVVFANIETNSPFLHVQRNLFIGLGILGFAIVVFALINFSNNRKKKKSKSNANSTLQPPLYNDDETTNFEILNNHPTPSSVIRNDGIILFVNNSFANVFGSSPDNMKRLLLYNILPAHISASLSFSFSEKENKSGASTNSFFSPNTKNRYRVIWHKYVNRALGQNNLLITLEVQASTEPVKTEKPKNITGEEILQQILDSSPTAIYIEDFSGCVLQANKTACAMHGINKDEIIGKSISDLSPDDFRKEITHRHHFISENESIKLKSVAYPVNANPIPVEILVNKINYFGTHALLFIVTDLTDSIERKKELDEYKIKSDESDRLKSSFLSNLSHEVRTPLNSIMGFSELLAQPQIETKEREEFIKHIQHGGKELLAQINNMIDFSKIEAGLINLKIEICNFEDLFNKLHEYAYEELNLSNDIKLFFELSNDIVKNGIATDYNRLKQILKIFLSNSIKHTPKGVIEIGVRLKAPQLYEFYVRDTGIGIPQDKHRQIFEKFRQADDTHSRQFSGMGLGLSIASRLIQFLGGHQWVISKPVEGAEFRCVLPDLLHPHGSPMKQVSEGPSTMLKKVMIVAPNEDVYLDLCNDSKPFNYQIFWAQNAQEMRSMLLSNNIKHVLIDVDQLPFWQELLPKIKIIENDAKLIGVSNTLDMNRKKRLISMGLNDAMRTPINIPILLSILENNELTAIHSLTSVFNQN